MKPLLHTAIKLGFALINFAVIVLLELRHSLLPYMYKNLRKIKKRKESASLCAYICVYQHINIESHEE